MLKIKKTKFKGLISINGELHKDKRGYLRELLIEKHIKKRFKFHIISTCIKRITFSVRKSTRKIYICC